MNFSNFYFNGANKINILKLICAREANHCHKFTKLTINSDHRVDSVSMVRVTRLAAISVGGVNIVKVR